ncbi:hypothetical protein RMATCC62417_15251 [Rhizopus microsporus]|nr:hypothetical protein RMATCC62417_15251 [Rhizopus microsporus]
MSFSLMPWLETRGAKFRGRMRKRGSCKQFGCLRTRDTWYSIPGCWYTRQFLLLANICQERDYYPESLHWVISEASEKATAGNASTDSTRKEKGGFKIIVSFGQYGLEASFSTFCWNMDEHFCIGGLWTCDLLHYNDNIQQISTL